MKNKNYLLGIGSLLIILSSFVFAQNSLTTQNYPQKAYVSLEHVFSNEQELQTGDIVTFSQLQDSVEPLQLSKAEVAYDPRVIGVVVQESVDELKPPIIAVFGEVYVHIATDKGLVQRGDFVTSSTLSGIGMKAEQPGFVLGKALEDLASSSLQVPVAKLKILLSPTWLDASYFARQQILENSQLQLFDTSELDLSSLRASSSTFDASGNLRLDGALTSTGNITSTGDTTLLNLFVINELTTGKIAAPAFENAGIWLGDSLGATKLDILDSNGTIQASINSDGNVSSNAAVFGKLSIDPALQTIGTFTLSAGRTSVFVDNTMVTDQSYIFITPKNSTAGQVAYLADQKVNEGFVVAIDLPLSRDVEFNYWIVN